MITLMEGNSLFHARVERSLRLGVLVFLTETTENNSRDLGKGQNRDFMTKSSNNK